MTEQLEQRIPVVDATFYPLRAARQRIVVLEGSARSGKTWSIIMHLILCALAERVRIFAGRHDGATCDDSIVADFQDIMELWQLWQPNRWNKTEKKYTFENGSVWKFGGTKEQQKKHGRKQDYLWLNETMEIPESTWTQLAIRTTGQIILDFNPSFSQHWVFSQVLTQPESEVAYIHSTYRDNPFLPDVQVREIEKLEPTPQNRQRGTADEWKWQVYGLGKRGRPEGAIYKLYDLRRFPGPHAVPAVRLRSGLRLFGGPGGAG